MKTIPELIRLPPFACQKFARADKIFTDSITDEHGLRNRKAVGIRAYLEHLAKRLVVEQINSAINKANVASKIVTRGGPRKRSICPKGDHAGFDRRFTGLEIIVAGEKCARAFHIRVQADKVAHVFCGKTGPKIGGERFTFVLLAD